MYTEMKNVFFLIFCLLLIYGVAHVHAASKSQDILVSKQTNFILRNAQAIEESMAYLNSPLSQKVRESIASLARQPITLEAKITSAVEQLLDPYCIATVKITSDGRVEVSTKISKYALQQSGWTNYLVKIENKAAYAGRLKVQSPNAEALFVETRDETSMRPEEMLTKQQLQERYLAVNLYRNTPLSPTLSGNPVEYAILQLYTKRSGSLQADIDFFIGDYYKNMRPIESSFLRTANMVNGITGLKGEYFDNTAFTGEPVLTRIDSVVDFNWTGGSPDASLPKEDYSVRWTGQIVVKETGHYRLGIRSNDGSRIYLDRKLLVNNWGLHGTVLKTGEVPLEKGQAYELRIEYFQGGGSAEVRLEWDDGPLNTSRIQLDFDSTPAIPITLRIKDNDGLPTMASLTITDGIDRYEQIPIDESKYGQTLNFGYSDYERKAQREYEYFPTDLKGIYPLPSKRVAFTDHYPDQYFHAQVYRSDGEQVLLPPGKYTVSYTRGPEYRIQSQTVVVPENVKRYELSIQLDRWIHMRKLGYYSSDSHIHASGCCYYTNPEEGLKPEHVRRMQLGEDVNVANILNWGPNWYHQKNYFTGDVHPLSKDHHIMQYNVEISGFPSSHAGHIVLLGLLEDDYPGTTLIEDWPTWNLPILKWAKEQGAITGYAHSGWGLVPMESTWELPNYSLPKMNDIGANEYIVTITEGVVDFYSVGDTPVTWELNMWYHSLNCGFRPRLSGETDYPCIYDERVGEARSYAYLEGPLEYTSYLDSIKKGHGYVSDGRTHIIDFSVDDTPLISEDSEIEFGKPKTVKIKAKVAAFLPVEQTKIGHSIASSSLDRQPYWHIERARIGTTREIEVELIANGNIVGRKRITSDGDWKELYFEYNITESSWLALRVYPSAHTNPIFVIVDGKPIHDKQSARWSRSVVDQCWEMKEGNISPSEHSAALKVFKRARSVYDKIIQESP
jgi:hypothetical protein